MMAQRLISIRRVTPILLLLGLSLLRLDTPLQAATRLVAWGKNENGFDLATSMPAAATNVIAMAGGDGHVLALRADGTVVAWGPGCFNGEANVPPDATNVVAIVGGSGHSIALRADGSARFWGKVIWSGVTNLPAAAAANLLGLAPGPCAQFILGFRPDGSVVSCGNTDSFLGLTNVPSSATNVVAAAAGPYHGLVLRADGKLATWGKYATFDWVPVKVATSLTGIVAVSSGNFHDLALQSNGTLVTWGSSASLALNPPAAATNIVAIASGANHSLALRADGRVFAWGNNGYGQTNVPPDLTNVAAIAATTYGGLALTVDPEPPILAGAVVPPALLGGTARLRISALSATPMRYQWSFSGTNLPGATNATLTLTNVQFSQAGAYAIVVSNAFGSVTNADLNLVVVPFLFLQQPEDAAALVGGNVTISATAVSSLALSYQWRRNDVALGGATRNTLSLTNVQPLHAGAYSVVLSNALGLLTSSLAQLTVMPLRITNPPLEQCSFPGGTVTWRVGVQTYVPLDYQWHFKGTVIDGATASSLTLSNLQYSQGGTYSVSLSNALIHTVCSADLILSPIAVWGENYQQHWNVPAGLTNLAAIAASSTHRLALRADGTVMDWGSHSAGQAAVPADLTNAISIKTGTGICLALRADGTVRSWSSRSDPPADLTNVVQIAAGAYHGLALKSDGTVVAWGDDRYGQTNLPAPLTDIVAVSAGQWHSLALRADGTVLAWGQTIEPPALQDVVAISAGGSFSLALKANGTVVGWGDDYSRECSGAGTVSNVVAISAGYSHALALRADGTVVAWGSNTGGESNVPPGLPPVVQIAASYGGSTVLSGATPPTLHTLVAHPVWTNGVFSCSIPTQSDYVYRLEFRHSLGTGDWTALPLVPGNGTWQTLSDPTPSDAPRFYRVRRW